MEQRFTNSEPEKKFKKVLDRPKKEFYACPSKHKNKNGEKTRFIV